MNLMTIAVLACMVASAAATLKSIPGELGRIHLFLDFDKDNNTLLSQGEFAKLCATFGQKDPKIAKLYFNGFEKQKGTNDIGIYGYLKHDKAFFKNIGESLADRRARLAQEKKIDATFNKFNKNKDHVLSKGEFINYALATWSKKLINLFGKDRKYMKLVAGNTYEGVVQLLNGDLDRQAFRESIEKRRFYPRFL